jgi:hypothetical protein
MSARTAARLAWSLWALSLAFTLVNVAFRVLNSSTPTAEPRGSLILEVGFFLLFVSFATVGALVASQQPGNTIGWIFCALGLSGPLSGAGAEYALHTFVTSPGSLPGGGAIAWLAQWLGGAVNFAMIAFVFLLFPDGRLLSRRWRPVIWLNLVAIVLIFVWSFKPGPIDNLGLLAVDNPFGVTGAGALLETVGNIGFFLALAAAIAGAVSLILRLRRSRGDERQQIKWFVFAGAVSCAIFATGPVLWSLPASPATAWVWPTLFLLGVSTIPVATGVAILRYRLYDIDLVINRTLVYGSLTVTLAFVYLGSVVLLQGAFRILTGQGSTLAVVASTLAIAALFSPLRRRIQNVIDRRFYRGKYDAARTLEAFSGRLRDETDLNTLSEDLVSVVRETVQPEHASLWLRSTKK